MNVIEKRPGRVLVVEDNAKWRNGLRDRLRRKGYYVQTAATRQEAAERLEFDYYHVLILDIRLEEEDTYNVEGMEILSELGGRKLDMTMSIVMISAYGTMEQMREAFRDYDIVDFQSKLNFDLIPFVEDVKRILIEKTKINLELRVEWKNGSSAESCTAKLRLGKNLVASDPVLHKRVSAELDDLLCRLFFDKEVVKIEPMSPGFSGTGVLRVTAFDAEHGIALPVVCKYGDTGKISKEEQNFREFVEGHVGGNRSTIALGGRQTPVLGGLLFSFLGV
jgi:CheY-like chemotaxis protein